MLRGDKPDAESLDAFDRIHCATSSTRCPIDIAARVIASTLSDMYGAMVGAVASLKGPLHGGANEAAIEFLMDITARAVPDTPKTTRWASSTVESASWIRTPRLYAEVLTRERAPDGLHTQARKQDS